MALYVSGHYVTKVYFKFSQITFFYYVLRGACRDRVKMLATQRVGQYQVLPRFVDHYYFGVGFCAEKPNLSRARTQDSVLPRPRGEDLLGRLVVGIYHYPETFRPHWC